MSLGQLCSRLCLEHRECLSSSWFPRAHAISRKPYCPSPLSYPAGPSVMEYEQFHNPHTTNTLSLLSPKFRFCCFLLYLFKYLPNIWPINEPQKHRKTDLEYEFILCPPILYFLHISCFYEWDCQSFHLSVVTQFGYCSIMHHRNETRYIPAMNNLQSMLQIAVLIA